MRETETTQAEEARSEGERERERERERENPKQALHYQLRAQHRARTHETVTS